MTVKMPKKPKAKPRKFKKPASQRNMREVVRAELIGIADDGSRWALTLACGHGAGAEVEVCEDRAAPDGGDFISAPPTRLPCVFCA